MKATSTIRTQRITPPDLATRAAARSRSNALAATPASERFVVGDLLGKGGMGKIYEAKQAVLSRSVAVKTAATRDIDALIAEARITGLLEHPNIVPIHDIAADTNGAPLVVLKRIEGTTWRQVVASSGADGGPKDPRIERHVRIALQVAQALRFAHSQGLVHRDVKPSNVMIGEFGEVYLLDWGLAMSFDGERDADFPVAERGVCGTPAYMAPEQFDDTQSEIGPHTDVYLLAASLFHALTGAPPQRGRDLALVVTELARRTQLDLPSWVPSELSDVLNRAMTIAIEQRTPTIDVFRKELETYLDHVGSRRLVAQGMRASESMREFHRANLEAPAECAFFDATSSYRAALDAWRGNDAAAQGLIDTVVERAGHLLDAGAPDAARRVVALTQVPEALTARIDAALATRQDESNRLKQYERDEDRGFGLGTRQILNVLVGGALIAGWGSLAVLAVESPIPVLAGSGVLVAVLCALMYRHRTVMWEVRLNRHNVGISFGMMFGQLLLAALAVASGDSYAVLIGKILPVWLVGSFALAATVDRRFLGLSVVVTAALVVYALAPSLRWWTPVGCSVGFLLVVTTMNRMTRAQLAKQT